jgi:hypothetical protein
MSGKDDAVDKEIERLMALERNEFRFSKRSYLFVLGSGDRDFAQAVRACSAEGIPVMVLAKKGGIAEAHRSNFDFSDDNWKQLMQACSVCEGWHSSSRKRQQAAIMPMYEPGGARYHFEAEAPDSIAHIDPIASSSGASLQVDADGSACRDDSRTMQKRSEGSFTVASSTTATEAAVKKAEPRRTVDDFMCEIRRFAKGSERERILLEMERAEILPDPRFLDLVLSGYIYFKDRARVLECRRTFVTSGMVVVLLSSEDISNHVEDAVQFTMSLPDGLLCHDGVLVRLIPICADANNEDFLMRLWELGETKLASWPDKLKRSMNKRRELIRNTSAWQILQTLLGIYVLVSECSEPNSDGVVVATQIAKNSLNNNSTTKQQGSGWRNITSNVSSSKKWA